MQLSMTQKLEVTRQNEYEFWNQHIKLAKISSKILDTKKFFFFVELCYQNGAVYEI